MSQVTAQQLDTLYQAVSDLYASEDDLPFHGWHHIDFVYAKTAIFADDLGADKNLAQAAALVHDLNYLAKRHALSYPEDGQHMRVDLLQRSGFSDEVIAQIEMIVTTGEVGRGGEHLLLEAKALSDADILFKIIPTTPLLFTTCFLAQNHSNIRKLANRVVTVQKPLIDQDIYFYSDTAKNLYIKWAHMNLALWENVLESLDDPDIVKMLAQAGFDCDDTLQV